MKATQGSLDLAAPVLEDARERFVRNGSFDPHELETQLKHVLGTGYQSVKSFVAELASHSRYRLIALYYMENLYPHGPAMEFNRPLATAYGAKHYDSAEGHEARAAFWKRYETSEAREAA